MRVSFNGRSFDTVDWSLGGCRVSFVGDFPEVGSEHTLNCSLAFQGFEITLKVEARVVRQEPERRELAFCFTDVGERETALLQHFVEDLIRGKMSTVADTIVRIDTPVTPVATTPDPNPIKAVPVRRWAWKQFLFVSFYLVLGAVVFGYIALYFYALMFQMEVTSAVVSSERAVVTSPVAGQVNKVDFAVGATISAGAPLVYLENTILTRNLRVARAELAETEAELAEAQSVLAGEEEKAKGYDLVARNNVRQAETQLEKLQLANKNAQLKVERMRKLTQKGLALADDLEAAELELKAVLSEYERKKIHIQELKQLIKNGDATRLFTGNGFAGRLSETKARISRLRRELTYKKDALQELEQVEPNTIVRAPFDAVVMTQNATVGSPVKLGEPLFVLEGVGTERVTAFVSQDEASQLLNGSIANVFVPSEQRWIEGIVSEVDRTDGFVDEVTEAFRFRAPDAKSAKVTLEFRAPQTLQSGTPVIVYFHRHRNNRVWRTYQQIRDQFK